MRRESVGEPRGTVARELQLAPVQVCPICRDPKFSELALRDIQAKQRFGRFGRAAVAIRTEWASDICPNCGSRLVRECPADVCNAPILSADDSHCRSCGRPYSWIQGRDWRKHAARIGRAGRTELWALVGDITTIAVDAIVIGEDVRGRMVGEVGRAVLSAGGAQIERDSTALGPFELGQSWQTAAGSLPADRVIHVAVMTTEPEPDTDEETISKATRNALALAEELSIRSIALPAIGTGYASFPIEQAGTLMGAAVEKHVGNGESKLRDVVFVLYGAEDYTLFITGLRAR